MPKDSRQKKRSAKKQPGRKKGSAKEQPGRKKGSAKEQPGRKKRLPKKRRLSENKAAPGERGVSSRRRPPLPRSSKASSAQRDAPHPDGERLQKVLAAAGIGSRRECEELITTGRVEVDRKTVTELGTRVDPAKQRISLDGTVLPTVKLVYYVLNKPTGVVSTNRDPAGRPRVIDLVPQTGARLFPVGRLDFNSEGLILVTNDGELANRLTHPRYGIEKTYRVQVAGRPNRVVLAQLRRGVRIAEAVCQIEHIKIKSHYKASTNLEMVLREGRNREIRRVLAKLGHKVMRLIRVAVGPVRLAKLPSGESRPLSRQELKALREAVAPKKQAAAPRKQAAARKKQAAAPRKQAAAPRKQAAAPRKPKKH